MRSSSCRTLTEVSNPVRTIFAVPEKVGESHCVCQTSCDIYFFSQRPNDFLCGVWGDLKRIICPPQEPSLPPQARALVSPIPRLYSQYPEKQLARSHLSGLMVESMNESVGTQPLLALFIHSLTHQQL